MWPDKSSHSWHHHLKTYRCVCTCRMVLLRDWMTDWLRDGSSRVTVVASESNLNLCLRPLTVNYFIITFIIFISTCIFRPRAYPPPLSLYLLPTWFYRELGRSPSFSLSPSLFTLPSQDLHAAVRQNARALTIVPTSDNMIYSPPHSTNLLKKRREDNEGTDQQRVKKCPVFHPG